MTITSTAFTQGQDIPEKYTCDGEDISPPLQFSDIPEGTVELALIVSDPDAPGMTFNHWVVYGIDPSVGAVTEDSAPGKSVMGRNDVGNLEYAGPCPPQGIHHYIFRLYALDTALQLAEGLSAGDVEEAMQGHILETAELTGMYGKT